MTTRHTKRGLGRSGYTLVEIIAAITVMGIAFPAIAYMFSATAMVDSDVNVSTQAYFLANSLMSEISERRFWQSPSLPGNGPDAGEVNGYNRLGFNDIDDYAAFKTWGKLNPPRDESGNIIPNSSMYSQYVTVVNVNPPGANGQSRSLTAVADGTTDFKLVTVTISWNRGSYSLQKVFARP